MEKEKDDGLFDLLGSLEIIVKRKRRILRTSITAFIVSIIVSLFLPKWYQSTARILPPQQDSGLMGLMMGQAGAGLGSLAGDLLGKGTSSDLYVGLAKSEAVSDAIIDKFNLIEVYGEKYRNDTYNKLEEHVRINAGKKDGIVSIEVEDKDPKRAADIANAYIEELGSLTARVNLSTATPNRAFLDQRLSKTKADLARAQNSLKEFQSKHKVADISEQGKGIIKGIADLEAQLAIEEVKLATLRTTLTDNSSEIKTQQEAISGIKRQIAKFEGARPGNAIPGLSSVPELSQEYVNLMREFKFQETLFELLTKQLELAKLDEAKQFSTIQVIQKARVPDKKSRPKRAFFVFITTFSFFILSVLSSIIQEYIERMTSEEQLRWQNIFRSIRFRP